MLIVEGRRSLYAATPGISDDPDFRPRSPRWPAWTRWRPRCRSLAPWKAPRAHEWDDQTLAQFRDQTSARRRERALQRRVTSDLGRRAGGALAALRLFYVAAAGNPTTPGSFVRLFTTRRRRAGVALRRRLASVPNAWPGDSGAASCSGRPCAGSKPAARPGHGDSRTGSRSRPAASWSPCRRCSQRRSTSRPRFPPQAQAAQKLTPGTTLKLEATYDRPWWRDLGLSGQANSTIDPVNATFDNTPPQGAPGIVFGFVVGGAARALPATARGAPGRPTSTTWSTCFGEEAREHDRVHPARLEP